MSEPRRAPEPAPRRSAVRRDLLVIAAASVVAVWLGVSFDLFRHLHRELDAAPGIYADAVVGAIVILVIAAGSFAFIRNRAARTEEALRTETERRYQAIVEQQPAVTYTWDPSIGAGGAATLYIGPQIERLLGYTPEDWLAGPVSGYGASTPTTATAWSRHRSDRIARVWPSVRNTAAARRTAAWSGSGTSRSPSRVTVMAGRP